MVDKHARHVWISSHLLHSDNVHENCNLGARQRLWDRDQPPGRKVPGLPLRTRLLVYLERDERLPLPDAPGAPGQCSGMATKRVASHVRTLGVQAFLRWVRESCAHRWLRREWIEHFRTTPVQLRLE